MDESDQEVPSKNSQQALGQQPDKAPQLPFIAQARMGKAPADQPATEQQLQQTEEKIETRMSAFERTTIRLTRAGVIIGIITVLIFSGQLYEMFDAGTQTNKIISAARQIEADLKAANQQNLDALRRTLEQSHSDADRSYGQSQQVLNATIAQARLAQRAFISFATALQGDPVQGSSNITEWEFRPVLENSGQTPAQDVRIHLSWLYVPAVLTANFAFPDLGPPKTYTPVTLGPKQNTTGPVATVATDILSQVHQKKLHLYFYGWLTYRDIFPKAPLHVSMFCRDLTDARLPSAGTPSYQFAWEVCPRHNCADEGCNGEPYGTPAKIWPN